MPLALSLKQSYFTAQGTQELVKTERHLSLCRCIGLNDVNSTLFIDLMSRYSLSHKASIPDMLIAATAISHELELYTLNSKDFKFIPELNLYLTK